MYIGIFIDALLGCLLPVWVDLWLNGSSEDTSVLRHLCYIKAHDLNEVLNSLQVATLNS